MTMQITSKELIAGHPAMKVRLLLRHIQLHDAVTARFIGRLMDLNDERARRFSRKLVELRFLKQLDPEEQKKLAKVHRTRYTWYRCAERGQALAMASAARRIKRSTAEAIVEGFMDRVRQVNEAEEYCYNVTAVVLYGSFLSGRLELGDVDFAVQLTPRLSNSKAFRELERKRIQEAIDGGRTFRNITMEVIWAAMEIYMFLRARKRSVSIHDLSELAELAKTNPLHYRVLLGDKQAIRERLGPNAIEV
jgi:predicted nucleotidyltransferase